MIKKLFIKYARAVSDEGERRTLFNKFRAQIIMRVIFFAFCIAFIISAAILANRIEESMVFDLMTFLLCAAVLSGIAALVLWLSLKRMYREILTRPAYRGEMPEVAGYRQKVTSDKKATFKKIWWAWLVFGICAAAFIVLTVLEGIHNAADDKTGLYGTIGIWLLVAGGLVLFIAYFTISLSIQQKSDDAELKAAEDIAKIDLAQGREPEINARTDINARADKIYTYLFPNQELRSMANEERVRRAKISLFAIIALTVAAIAGAIAFLLCGAVQFALPFAMTVTLLGFNVLNLATGGKLRALEKRQKAELESNPEYADNLEWYKLNDKYYRVDCSIYLAIVAIAVALGWLLAALYPQELYYGIAMLALIIPAMLLNSLAQKRLRKKAIPIEKAIDGKAQKRDLSRGACDSPGRANKP